MRETDAEVVARARAAGGPVLVLRNFFGSVRVVGLVGAGGIAAGQPPVGGPHAAP